MPICPHNSSRLFYPQKASISKHSIARCWRSWRSLTPRLWADWETLLTTAHSTGPFTAKWWTTETQVYIFFWLLLCSNTWPRKGWCWQLPSNNRGRKGCRRNNWVWRKYHRKVVISFVDVCFFGPPVIRTCFREGNYVEPTIVTGLPHDAPVVHRWISKKDKRLSWIMKTEFERWKSVSFLAVSASLPPHLWKQLTSVMSKTDVCHKFRECGHRWRILINVYEKLQHKVFKATV